MHVGTLGCFPCCVGPCVWFFVTSILRLEDEVLRRVDSFLYALRTSPAYFEVWRSGRLWLATCYDLPIALSRVSCFATHASCTETVSIQTDVIKACRAVNGLLVPWSASCDVILKNNCCKSVVCVSIQEVFVFNKSACFLCVPLNQGMTRVSGSTSSAYEL